MMRSIAPMKSAGVGFDVSCRLQLELCTSTGGNRSKFVRKSSFNRASLV